MKTVKKTQTIKDSTFEPNRALGSVATNFQKIIFFTTCFLYLFGGQALSQVYKYTDDAGNIIYSDSPPPEQPDLSPAELPPVIYQPAVVPEQRTTQKNDSEEKLHVSISSPEPDAFILPVQPSFPVSASLSRELKETENLTLFVNGQPHSAASKATTWRVGNLIRGEYKLSLVVTDETNTSIAESESVTIFVQRHIAR